MANEKTYFLFGKSASSAYDDNKGMAHVKRAIAEWGGQPFVFDPAITSAVELIDEYDGWEGYCVITEKDYNSLTNKKKKNAKR